MRNFILLILLTLSFNCFSQNDWIDFTGKQKAFFYQLSRKIENMEPQVFHLFEFTDSIPYINDTLPDYPYVEKQIVKDSSKLILHKSEFVRKNNGIIADIATHYAAWELDLVLQFRNSTKPKYNYLKPKLEQFEKYVIEKAPQTAIKTLSDGSYTLSPSIKQYFAVNLSIGEKIAAIKNATFSTNDQLLIIRSIYYAQEKYINKRAYEIFKLLGGKTNSFNNYLVAAGNGDNWSDLESVYRTKYNRPLPDPKSMFKFETKITTNKPKKKGGKTTKTLNVSDAPSFSLKTNANNATKIHFDVWGYHPERQTTIVIQKGGNSYILYGNNNNRYLSADSTFEGGSTYWRLINELENTHIAQLKEMIYGKKGFDYWIAEYKVKIQKTKLQIKKSEEALDKMRYQPTPPPKMKKKKLKKKNLGYSDQDNTGHAIGKMSGAAKKKNKEQSRLVHLNTQLQDQKAKLRQLIIDKNKAFDVLAQYETQLEKMKSNLGHTFVEYKKTKQGNYIFDDGSVFNVLEQDFTFNPDYREQNFDIITIAFGEKVFSKSIEESFVHINITYPKAKSKYTLYKDYQLKDLKEKISVSDSIQIQEFFKALGATNKKIKLAAYGGGILGGTSHTYYRDSTNNTRTYDKNFKDSYSLYENSIIIDNVIHIQLTAYRTNMIPFKFNEKYGKYYIKSQSKNSQINEIDFYTTLLAKKQLNNWLDELKKYANIWLVDEDYQTIVISKLNKLKNKSHYTLVGDTKIKLPKK